MASCGSEKANTNSSTEENHADHQNREQGETTPAISATYTVDTEASSIKWTAPKVFSSGHWGYINLQSGSIDVTDGEIDNGSFEVAMNTLTVEDMEDGDKKSSLVTHIKGIEEEKADDFFNINEYPTAAFNITSVARNEDGAENTHTINGDLTIKGHTESLSFGADITLDEDQLIGKGVMVVDRTKFGITYNSKNFFKDVADKYAIKDEFSLEIELVAAK